MSASYPLWPSPPSSGSLPTWPSRPPQHHRSISSIVVLSEFLPSSILMMCAVQRSLFISTNSEMGSPCFCVSGTLIFFLSPHEPFSCTGQVMLLRIKKKISIVLVVFRVVLLIGTECSHSAECTLQFFLLLSYTRTVRHCILSRYF